MPNEIRTWRELYGLAREAAELVRDRKFDAAKVDAFSSAVLRIPTVTGVPRGDVGGYTKLAKMISQYQYRTDQLGSFDNAVNRIQNTFGDLKDPSKPEAETPEAK